MADLRLVLLDHLVGGSQQLFWNGKAEKAEGFGGLHVDNQLGFVGSLYWQVAWAFAPKYSTGVDAG
jgi:hypothetical protein